MLNLVIVETVMYTTFEKVQFEKSDTMPTARRGRVGGQYIRMEKEWAGECFGLNLGERISFVHRPVQMVRYTDGILKGDLTEQTPSLANDL